MKVLVDATFLVYLSEGGIGFLEKLDVSTTSSVLKEIGYIVKSERGEGSQAKNWQYGFKVAFPNGLGVVEFSQGRQLLARDGRQKAYGSSAAGES